MSQRVLITGGAGFIGVNVARSFQKKGWRVSVLDAPFGLACSIELG